MEKKLKYNPSDYPDLQYYMEDIEKQYKNYILKNKDKISAFFLADSINELRNGLKSSIILKNSCFRYFEVYQYNKRRSWRNARLLLEAIRWLILQI